MTDFEKITHIVLYDLEKEINLCEGDKIVARYKIIDSEDLFDEGFTSQWNVKEYKETPG